MSGANIDLSQPIDWNKNDLEYLMRDFDVVPGDDGRWYLWWPAQHTWVARYSDGASAKSVLIGDWDGVSGEPGWHRAEFVHR